MSGRIFVFGSINTDLVVYLSRLPALGETVSGGTYASFPGGKGANQAVAAARAGAAVEMFGCVGDDAFGRERLSSLAETGISTRGVRAVAGVRSGVALILVDEKGENSIAVAPGANLAFDSKAVEIPRPAKGEKLVSLFQNEIPPAATEDLIARARAAGHTVIWNIAPTLKQRPKLESLKAASYIICNQNELAALTGNENTDLESAARIPLEWGVENMIVTLGKKGSFLASASAITHQEAFAVPAVDTVGAGDCFCGVFAASLMAGGDVKSALRRASAAAAISTTRKGAQTSMPMAAEIDAFLASRGA